MKLNDRLANAIVHELWDEKDRIVAESADFIKDRTLALVNAGRINGLMHAISLISMWNEPNHGKVVAQTAGGGDKNAG